MCEHDVGWVRTVPELPRLSGPLVAPLLALWDAIEADTLERVIATGRVGDLLIVDADTLEGATPGIRRLSTDVETETFRELTARFECSVCPTEEVARRSDSGAATGEGWACIWHTAQVSPPSTTGWHTVMDHLFVLTTLDRADGRPVLYHLADADAQSHFGRAADRPPCPPYAAQVAAEPADER